jgi:hypothetical protein
MAGRTVENAVDTGDLLTPRAPPRPKCGRVGLSVVPFIDEVSRTRAFFPFYV